jgi:hypothetical protein
MKNKSEINIQANVLRWRSKHGKALAHVSDYRKAKRNPNEHKFGNIGLVLEARLKG